MNKIRTTERLSGLLAFALSGLLYLAAVALVLFWMRNRPAPQFAFNPAPVNLSFAQIELQAADPEPPTPEPAPAPEEIKPEPLPPEPVDVAPKPEPPEPAPEPVKQEAQVSQQASAPEIPPADPNRLIAWVREQIEKEKYYPPAARNAGLEGQFRLLITIGTNGKVSKAVILDGKGHPMLRRSLEKIMDGLIGRDSGQVLPEPFERSFGFEFKLN